MTFDDMLWEAKSALYNELLDEGGRKNSEVYYDIAIFSALESIKQKGKKFVSKNNIVDKEQLLELLEETLEKYKQISAEYDGFDSTDEWKDSLETEDRKILDVFDELKQDKKTGAWVPANDRDKIYESIRENHSKLYNSWYFRDDDERNNLEDKIDNICYMITIINEFNRMNN